MTYIGGLYTGGSLHVLNVRIDGIQIHAECSACGWRRDRIIHTIQSTQEVRKIIDQEFEGYHSFRNRVRTVREEALRSGSNAPTDN